MARELPKVYEPQQVESQIYKMWEDNGYFRPTEQEGAKPFTIVMPPPNVTGQLHMGPHPCGEKRWLVLRTGADFRLRCLGCGHEVMTPRHKAEKNIRTVERKEISP